MNPYYTDATGRQIRKAEAPLHAAEDRKPCAMCQFRRDRLARQPIVRPVAGQPAPAEVQLPTVMEATCTALVDGDRVAVCYGCFKRMHGVEGQTGLEQRATGLNYRKLLDRIADHRYERTLLEGELHHHATPWFKPGRIPDAAQPTATTIKGLTINIHKLLERIHAR